MDFIVGLPRTSIGFDFIWEIVDTLTMLAHFLPLKMSYGIDRLVKLYVDRIH